MNGLLIDTNVLSEYSKAIPDARVVEWLRAADPYSLFASVVSVGELRLGVEALAAGKRRAELEAWLAGGLPGWFAANLLPITGSIADRWGRLTIQAKRNGTPLTMADGLIAATAVEHDLVLVTRNVKDFRDLSLTHVNPWDAQG